MTMPFELGIHHHHFDNRKGSGSELLVGKGNFAVYKATQRPRSYLFCFWYLGVWSKFLVLYAIFITKSRIIVSP